MIDGFIFSEMNVKQARRGVLVIYRGLPIVWTNGVLYFEENVENIQIIYKMKGQMVKE